MVENTDLPMELGGTTTDHIFIRLVYYSHEIICLLLSDQAKCLLEFQHCLYRDEGHLSVFDFFINDDHFASNLEYFIREVK